MSMIARCKCLDGSVREVELEELGPAWSVTAVYDIREDVLGVRVDNVLNLEDIIAEVEYLRDFPDCGEEA